MLIAKVLIGFVVGTLIGMTGVGGGVLLLPVLIFVLRVPPIVAVGSDAIFNFATKIRSRWVQLRSGAGHRQYSRIDSWRKSAGPSANCLWNRRQYVHHDSGRDSLDLHS